MARKSASTALMFNPFSGIDNPRRRNMSRAAGGALGVGLVAGVAAIVGTMVGATAMSEAQGTEAMSGANIKAKAIVGGVTALVAGLATLGIAKLAK